ncbi:MAG: hypothetical protein LBE12_13525, partial [Planctomycetaceae bacterium]|nr:hypothetical protein [Planctomycetaceae bacterium]
TGFETGFQHSFEQVNKHKKQKRLKVFYITLENIKTYETSGFPIRTKNSQWPVKKNDIKTRVCLSYEYFLRTLHYTTLHYTTLRNRYQ